MLMIRLLQHTRENSIPAGGRANLGKRSPHASKSQQQNSGEGGVHTFDFVPRLDVVHDPLLPPQGGVAGRLQVPLQHCGPPVVLLVPWPRPRPPPPRRGWKPSLFHYANFDFGRGGSIHVPQGSDLRGTWEISRQTAPGLLPPSDGPWEGWQKAGRREGWSCTRAGEKLH